MRKDWPVWLTLIAVIVMLVWSGFISRSADPLPQVPQVKTYQQTDGAAESQTHSQQRAKNTEQIAPSSKSGEAEDSNREPSSNSQKSAEEAGEYWPFLILGARLKITDSLLALFTFVLMLVSIVQGYFIGNTDKSARVAANVARESLIAAQRAWIKINSIDVHSPRIYPPSGLTIDHNWADVPIFIKISNVGTAPALKVKLIAQMVPVSLATIGKPYDTQKELAAAVRKGGFSVGMTLFPNESFPSNADDIWSYPFRVPRSEIDNVLESTKLNKILLLYIVGFIDYTFPTDITSHHQTGFVMQLHRRDGLALNHAGGFIPAIELALNRPPMDMGWYAD